MNLLYNTPRKNIWISLLFIAISFGSAFGSNLEKKDNTSEINIRSCSTIKYPNDFIKVLNLFTIETSSNSTKKYINLKCNQYISNMTRYSLSVNQKAVKNLMGVYCNDVNKLETCLSDQKKNKLSNRWANDLTMKFGSDNIIKYNDSIKKILEYLYMKQEVESCTSCKKNALYSEFLFMDSLRTYLDLLLEFSKTLSKEENEIIQSDLEICKKLQYTNNSSTLMEMLSGSNDIAARSLAAISLMKGVEYDMMIFMSYHPELSKTFDYFKAIEQLEISSSKGKK